MVGYSAGKRREIPLKGWKLGEIAFSILLMIK